MIVGVFISSWECVRSYEVAVCIKVRNILYWANLVLLKEHRFI